MKYTKNCNIYSSESQSTSPSLSERESWWRVSARLVGSCISMDPIFLQPSKLLTFRFSATQELFDAIFLIEISSSIIIICISWEKQSHFWVCRLHVNSL